MRPLPHDKSALARSAAIKGPPRRRGRHYFLGGHRFPKLHGAPRGVSGRLRLRVGDCRVIFVETDAKLSIIRVVPRGSVFNEGT